jgi:hypothetical protein
MSPAVSALFTPSLRARDDSAAFRDATFVGALVMMLFFAGRRHLVGRHGQQEAKSASGTVENVSAS